jgi:hypothetical protein
MENRVHFSYAYTYRMRGYFNTENVLEKIETWLDDPIFGDMLVEAEFSGYRNFDGLRFPERILHKQGGLAIFELIVDRVVPNTTASTAPPQAAGGRGGQGGGGVGVPAPVPAAAVVEMAPGVFVLDGAYQAVAVAFNHYSVVIDGMQNEARTRAVIDQRKKAIPGKPIRYVVVPHSHFDHVTGLRDFVAEGATILTHESTARFFERALSTPRTHDMLVAYIPSAKTIIESDLVQPWISPQFTNKSYLEHLANELDRLKLNYDSFVSIHRPTPPPTVTRAALMTAIGRTN